MLSYLYIYLSINIFGCTQTSTAYIESTAWMNTEFIKDTRTQHTGTSTCICHTAHFTVADD